MPLTNHLIFDLFAYAAAFALTSALAGLAARPAYPVPMKLRGPYLFVVTNGVILGSLGFGTLNLMLTGIEGVLGKSVLGAIVGGIIAVELFKKINRIQGSTGLMLVPGMALGIAIGRIGCFTAGLPDQTHGIVTDVPWGVDFGDGLNRHPVQLYESLAMMMMLMVSLWLTFRRHRRWMSEGFYWFTLIYASQRFVWEFFKPYAAVAPEWVPGINLFHLLCLGLGLYAITMIKRVRQTDPALLGMAP